MSSSRSRSSREAASPIEEAQLRSFSDSTGAKNEHFIPNAQASVQSSASARRDAAVQANQNNSGRADNDTIGVRKGSHQRQRLPAQNVEPRGYKKKFASDERYAEADSDARVWQVYNDECAVFDSDMINETNGNLDILLIFAGLFSSVLTTFVAQTSQALSPDPNATTNAILLELVALQRAQANGTSIDSIPTADLSFTPSPNDIWVNGFWFASLSLSLSTALFAVLAKQWLRQYSSFISGSPRERAFVRQFRFDNFEKWNVHFIIGLLPTVLHLALLLSMLGVVIYLFSLNSSLAYFHAIFGGILGIIYIIASTLPVFLIQCPYHTPFSEILWQVYLLTQQFIGWIYHGVAEKSIPEAPPSLTVVERRAVRGLGAKQFSKTLRWLHYNTADISAKAIVTEAIGAAYQYTDIVAHWNLEVSLQQQLTIITSRFHSETQTAEDETRLGQLLCASVPENPIPVSEFFRLTLKTSDLVTMLVTTAVFGCTSHFCWGNDPDEKPAVIAPHNVLNFVIDFCHDKDIVHAPRWVWWMLFARASSRNKFLKNHREAYLEMHNRIFNHRKDNIDYYNMFDWVAGLSLPDEFLDAALGAPSFGDSGVKEMGWDRFGKRKYDLPDSPCLVVPLTDFLRENFLVLIQAKADDSFIKDTGFQVSLLCNMIRQHIENMQSKEEKHRNEELVEQLKPFLQQADKIMIKATTLIKRVDRKEVVTDSEKKKAALKVMIEEIRGIIEWARAELDLKGFTKAKDNLGFLLVIRH